jgi:hypothetical protein
MAEHTGAWITAGYVVLSLLGLLHQAMVLRRFGVNFVEYAQLADFLLAAIRDPFVVLASAIPGVLVYGFYVWFGQWTSHRNPAKFLEGRRKNPRMTDPRFLAALQLLTGVVWAISFQIIYANVVSGRIRRGEGARVAISLSNAGIPPRPLPHRLGADHHRDVGLRLRLLPDQLRDASDPERQPRLPRTSARPAAAHSDARPGMASAGGRQRPTPRRSSARWPRRAVAAPRRAAASRRDRCRLQTVF